MAKYKKIFESEKNVGVFKVINVQVFKIVVKNKFLTKVIDEFTNNMIRLFKRSNKLNNDSEVIKTR